MAVFSVMKRVCGATPRISGDKRVESYAVKHKAPQKMEEKDRRESTWQEMENFFSCSNRPAVIRKTR